MSQTPSQELQDSQRKEREHFFGSAKIVAGLTMLSRVLGMFRDMTILWLGATWQTESFQFAFQLPNLFRRLFGEGALSAAFVPVFTEISEKGGPEKARKLLANALGLLAVLLVVLMVLVQAILLIWLAFSPPGRQDRQFLVMLTSIMLPYMFFVCMLALASAALNCRGHFLYPAMAPIILNLCMIAADGVATFFWDDSHPAQLISISASVTLAGVVQLGGVLWLLRRSGMGWAPSLKPIQEGVGKVLRLMAPALVVFGFLQFSSFFDSSACLFFSSNKFSGPTFHLLGYELHRPLAEGSLVRLVAAQRLYQLPMGVFAISLGTVVFPLLSRYAARNDMVNFRDSLNRALRLALMEGIATGVGLFVLAGPIIKLIYRHRDFTASDAQEASFILRMFVMGMWAYCSYQILTRTFYSLKDSKTPLRVTCCFAAVYMMTVCCLVWIKPLGAGAFGLTQSITFSVNVLVLMYILHRRLGKLGGRKIFISGLRSLACAGIMAGVLLWLLAEMTGDQQTVIPGLPGFGPLLRPSLGLGHFSNLAIVCITVPAGAVVFMLSAWLLRAPELGELLGGMLSKLRKKKTM